MMQRRDKNSKGLTICLRNVATGIVATLLLSACGSKEEPVTVAVKKVKREQVPEDPTAKMARAVTVGKSNVPVSLKYEILNRPIVGSPVEIELAVIPTFEADSMSLAFAGSAGLTVSADAAPVIETVKAGQAERVKLSVQAAEETVFYVNVAATIYSAGTSSVRNFAIPIIMGAPTPATPATEATEPAAAPEPKKS